MLGSSLTVVITLARTPCTLAHDLYLDMTRPPMMTTISSDLVPSHHREYDTPHCLSRYGEGKNGAVVSPRYLDTP